MDILIKIIAGVLLIYLYLSVFVSFYSMYVGRNLDKEPILGIKFLNNYFFFIGCLIGLIIFFAAGFERVLFFIPENWGSINEDGDWQPIKAALSLLFAFVTSIYLMDKAEEIFIRKRELFLKFLETLRRS